jgi:hypothetical protein
MTFSAWIPSPFFGWVAGLMIVREENGLEWTEAALADAKPGKKGVALV